MCFPPGYCIFNIDLLTLLCSPANKKENFLLFLAKIDTIARSPINFQLANSSKPFDVGSIPLLKPSHGDRDFRRCLSIQGYKPIRVRAAAIREQ